MFQQLGDGPEKSEGERKVKRAAVSNEGNSKVEQDVISGLPNFL